MSLGLIQVKALPMVAASMIPLRREFHFAKEITGAVWKAPMGYFPDQSSKVTANDAPWTRVSHTSTTRWRSPP